MWQSVAIMDSAAKAKIAITNRPESNTKDSDIDDISLIVKDVANK